MEHSSSWEANSHSAYQEIPYLLWNQNVHYCVNKIPWLDTIMSQLNPVYTPIPYCSKIHFNTILHLCVGIPSGLFLSDFLIKIFHANLIDGNPTLIINREDDIY